MDRGQLLASHIRPDGTLLVEGYAAREGILVYRDAAGRETRELVRAETLKAANDTLGRAPVTLGHPSEDVTPANVKELGVGDVDGTVVMAGGFVRVQMAVRSQDAIDAVRSGTKELSCGYAVQIDPTPGTHPVYGRYDAEQVARLNNHLAIVDEARAGHECAVRVDSAVATTVIRADSTGTPPARTSNNGARAARGGTVNPVLLQMLVDLGLRADGVTTDEAALSMLAPAVRQVATARTDGDRTHRAAIDAAHAERDAAKARADAAEAKVKTLEDAEKARVDAAERTRLDGIAAKLEIDPKAHATPAALKRAIAAKHLGSEVRADATDAYIDVLVDLAAAGQQQRGDGREAGRQAWRTHDAHGNPTANGEALGGQNPEPPPARQDGNAKRPGRYGDGFAFGGGR